MRFKNLTILTITEKTIEKIESTYHKLKGLAPLIYGSVGELKAIELFKRLPNGYYVINDYRQSFRPPLYNKHTDERIYSIQIDHIIIGPTGLFAVETKYWSKESIENNNFFSPVAQLKRNGYALFRVINRYITKNNFQAFLSSWGETKTSVINILLMMNTSTNQRFQFVTILTPKNFIQNITNRPVVLTDKKINALVNMLHR